MIGMPRRKSLMAIAAGIVAFSPRLDATAAQDTRCDEIVSIDSRNFRFQMPNGSSVQLKNGAAFLSDAREEGESKDWEVKLVQDEIIHPRPGQALRLMRLSSNHLTGSGSWD